MDTARVRKEINEYLQHADDRFLKLIHGMVKADQTTLSVGYKPDGTPITKEEMIVRAEKSEKDISEGRVKTARQVREEMKRW
ncbi:MAG: hypothetical protein WD426_09720 [Anditalea sp.]